jgi:Flp pilus assembly protein TadG
MAKVQNYGRALGKGGVSSRGGAYSNPQGRTNVQFADFMAGQKSVAQVMDEGTAALIANNKLERARQEQLFAEQNTEQRAMYDKVAGIKETGYGTFDQNMNDFFDDQVENYFKIKKGIKDGSIPQQEGNRHLSYLNQQVVGFRDAIVPIMAQTKALQEALKIPPGQPGSISSRVPTAQQEVLLALSQGGDVKLVDDNGQLCLFKPGEDGKEAAMINVNELLQLENSGKEYFKTVPDISESLKGVYNNTVKPGGKDNADLVMFETKRIGDQEATVKFMTPEQRTKAAESMVASNQFKGILDDEERMQSIWADMMGKDTDWMDVEGATAEETEANIKKQRDEAARWMANKSIEDNAAADGIKMIQSTRKYKAPGSGGSGGSGKSSLTDQAREERYNVYSEKADVLAKGKPEEVALALTEVNPVGKTYSVVDEAYVVDLMGDEDLEKYEDLKTKEEKTKFAEKLAKDNKIAIGSVVDEQGDIIPNTNTVEGIRAALSSEGGINLDQQTIYSKRRDEAANKAYQSKEPKPTNKEEYFEYNGRTYSNPNYKPNEGNPPKSFKDQGGPGQAGQPVAQGGGSVGSVTN